MLWWGRIFWYVVFRGKTKFWRFDESPLKIPSFPRNIGGGYRMVHLKTRKGKSTEQRPNNDFIIQMKWENAVKFYPSITCSVTSDSLRSDGLQPTSLLRPWDSPGKNIGVGCHFLLQGIFLTQGLSLCLLHCQADSLLLSHQASQCEVTHKPTNKQK